jgi:integrase
MSISLQEAADVFLAKYPKETTRLAYGRDIIHLMKFIAGAIPIDQIRGFDMERALVGVMNLEGVNSVHTLNKFVKTMRTFFNWAKKKGLIDERRNEELKLNYLATPDNDVLERTMSNEDYVQLVGYYTLLSTADPKKYQRILALVLFMGDTGTRREGLARLRWSDIDFKKNIASTYEKGDKHHKRPFGMVASVALREWQLLQKVKRDALSNQGSEIFVFSRDGIAVNGPAIAAIFRRACIAAGLEGHGPQSVRHNLGFRLQDAKVPDNLAAAVMGHTVDTYRKHYATTDDERIQKAALEVAFKYSELKPSILKIPKASNENP